MASRFRLFATTTGLYIYVYKQGLYVNSADRTQAVDTDNNAIYWFDSDALSGADHYDIGIYASDPGTGDHTTVYNAQKLDEREKNYFGSEVTDALNTAHIANITTNPHVVTFLQVVAAEPTLSALINVANTNKLFNGSDAGALHSHSSTSSLETIATGDGSNKTYAFTLDYFPAVPGTIIITDGVEAFADNGDGTLTGAAGGTGTINYATGVGSVTFKVIVVLSVLIQATYNYAKYTPNAHKTSHATGGSDALGAKDVAATVISIADAGSYYTGEDVELALQEVGLALKGVLAVPTGLAVSATVFPGLFAILNINWDIVSGAKYDISCTNGTTGVETINTLIATNRLQLIVGTDAAYTIKVLSRTINGVSAYSSTISVTVSTIGTAIDLVDIAYRTTMAISPSGNIYNSASGTSLWRSGNVTLVNGDNNNIVIGSATFIKISGPTAAFWLGGIAGGVDGLMITVWNTTAYNMGIRLGYAGSTAANRINTMAMGDVTITSASGSMATFIYDGTTSNWLLMNYLA